MEQCLLREQNLDYYLEKCLGKYLDQKMGQEYLNYLKKFLEQPEKTSTVTHKMTRLMAE